MEAASRAEQGPRIGVTMIILMPTYDAGETAVLSTCLWPIGRGNIDA